MFQQMPEGVFDTRRARIEMGFGETGYRILEIHVCLAHDQQIYKLLPDNRILCHSPFLPEQMFISQCELYPIL
jgi:hypothetical protein